MDRGLTCKLMIELGEQGSVRSVQLMKSSGDVILDRTAVAPIYKASPLPLPSGKAVSGRFKRFNLTLRPEGLL